MLNNVIIEGVKNLKKEGKMVELINHMNDAGFKLADWSDKDDVRADIPENIQKELRNFFTDRLKKSLDENKNKDDEKGKMLNDIHKANKENKEKGDSGKGKGDNNEDDKNTKGDGEQDKSKQGGEQDNKKDDEEEAKPLTKTAQRALYKNLDNLVESVESSEVTLENVREINEQTYGVELSGMDLATMFMHQKLVFDASMQRGSKLDKDGVLRANFNKKHVLDIYKSMLNGTFAPTQIQLALIVDDTDLEVGYDDVNNELHVLGKIRLLDGQHRVRALVKLYNEIQTGMINEDAVDLSSIVFNVQIFHVTAQRAREIYMMIDKNAKLDKSQVRQLQNDVYAKIANTLNQDTTSPLYDKVALMRPVQNKLTLFITLAEGLQKSVSIDLDSQMPEVYNYIKEFFTYVANKLPQAFSNNVDRRMEFRKHSLLNENNFFKAWIKVAFKDKDNFKKNVDKIVEHTDFFEKTNPVWKDINVVKASTGKNTSNIVSINNTNDGIDKMVDLTLALLDDKINEKLKEIEDNKKEKDTQNNGTPDETPKPTDSKENSNKGTGNNNNANKGKGKGGKNNK